MDLDPQLQPGRRAAIDCSGERCGGTLAGYAELVRRQLACSVVVIRIDAQVRNGQAAAGLAAVSLGGETADGAPAWALASDRLATLPRQARAEPALLTDPVAAGGLGYAFYAGLPLRLASGEPLGMLAALDREPRELAGNELATLKMLAAIIGWVAEARLVATGNGPDQTGG